MLVASTAEAQSQATLITNASVIDGTGAPAQLAEVRILNGRIDAIGHGTRTPTEDLAKACEGVGELDCNGALTELYEILGEKLKRRAYPGWFAAWPDKR